MLKVSIAMIITSAIVGSFNSIAKSKPLPTRPLDEWKRIRKRSQNLMVLPTDQKELEKVSDNSQEPLDFYRYIDYNKRVGTNHFYFSEENYAYAH
jgi:hypothetical protein